MLNYKKLLETFISIQIIIISSMIPVFILIPFPNKTIQTYEIPISWQITSIIIITLIFKAETAYKAFSLYLILGLFFLPVFHSGGSLGYILTPNFGYLLGIYPLINIVGKLNNNIKIDYYQFIGFGMLGIISMHFTGIIYTFLQMIFYIKTDTLIYNIANLSLGKFGYHLLMLAPITLLIKPINKIRYIK